jgi:hypothetical protein
VVEQVTKRTLFKVKDGSVVLEECYKEKPVAIKDLTVKKVTYLL